MATNQLNPERWVSAYADYLYQYVLKRIADVELSKDLVQDTFLSAKKSLADFRGKSSEKTWLTAILKSMIIDHYRKHSTEIFLNQRQLAAGKAVDFFEENGHWNNPLNISGGSVAVTENYLSFG